MEVKNIHPGEVLKFEFLDELELSAYRLALATGMPQTRVSEIIKGASRITADTALRLSKYFGTTPQFWLGLQDEYDLEEQREAKRDDLNNIKPYAANAA